MLCGRCDRARLCAACRERLRADLGRPAWDVGVAWADSVAHRIGTKQLDERDWPSGEKAREIARVKAMRLADDEELRDQLAEVIGNAARSRWLDLQERRARPR